MEEELERDWKEVYGEVIRRLPEKAAGAPLTFCGNGACIDARVSMHDIAPMLSKGVPEAARFAAFLQDRAARGQGGEVTYDWDGGPEWIAGNVPTALAIGGTGPHAAWALSTLNAPTLLALEDRSEVMLRLTPPEVLLVEDGHLVRAADARSAGSARSPVFIFEYTAGVSVGGVVPNRSSRVIVKFSHFGLERDDGFDQLTTARASRAGAGLVSGFTSVDREDLPEETARVGALARAWREGGLDTIHLELGGYDSTDMAHTVLDGLRGAMTSVGMSLSELKVLGTGHSDMRASMREFAEACGVDRICVHADNWAASLTRRDPEVEMDALLTGCLLAASRAAEGKPVLPRDLDPAAVFQPLPFGTGDEDAVWRFVACASPFLRSPRTTLGLGDTFTSGCLLALGAASRTESA